MEEEINEPMGEKKRINVSHPMTTMDITDLTGKNPVTPSLTGTAYYL